MAVKGLRSLGAALLDALEGRLARLPRALALPLGLSLGILLGLFTALLLALTLSDVTNALVCGALVIL